jgi:phosphoribosylanthranilate isomerase
VKAGEQELFRIKVCGITSQADAEMSVKAGADAIGLNFYPQSPRYVTPQVARDITAMLPTTVARVGVFVNSSLEAVFDVQKAVDLDWIQLHGDELPQFVKELVDAFHETIPTARTPRILRAFRCRDDGLQPVRDYLDRCAKLGTPLPAVLIDSYSSEAYGGTGHCVDWGTVARREESIGSVPTILAGGLTPNNVREAIEVSQAWGVDVASGVEAEPGVKSQAKVESFVRSAVQALLG